MQCSSLWSLKTHNFSSKNFLKIKFTPILLSTLTRVSFWNYGILTYWYYSISQCCYEKGLKMKHKLPKRCKNKKIPLCLCKAYLFEEPVNLNQARVNRGCGVSACEVRATHMSSLSSKQTSTKNWLQELKRWFVIFVFTL